jgi:hypothetical protein
MHCFQKFFTPITFSNSFKILWNEKKLLNDLEKNKFDEKDYFNKLRENFNFESFLKIMHVSPIFRKYCERKENSELWSQLYHSIGILISQDQENQITFNVSEDDNNLELLLGACYFMKSKQVVEQSNINFSYDEILFLKEAIKHKSIHALQRYVKNLYHKVHDETTSSDDRLKILEEIICSSKQFLEYYGSYAYMMVAEAYYCYSLIAFSKHDFYVAKIALTTAIKSCEFADQYHNDSQSAIFNASLGEGLKKSNSLNYSDPKIARQFLLNKLEVLEADYAVKPHSI